MGKRFTINKKLITFAVAIALPFLIRLVCFLYTTSSYSRRYDEIVSNLSVANNYNLNFKEEMDESLYKIVVGYTDFDSIGQDKSLRDPYELIRELREAFTRLEDSEGEEQSKIWLQSLLRNIDTLEKRVDDIRQSIAGGGSYEEHIAMLDDNIYILTELIQEDIQYFIYYQTGNMGKVSRTIQNRVQRFLYLGTLMVVVTALFVAIASVVIVGDISKSLQELSRAHKRLASGDLTARAQVKSRDELADLGDGFNHMADNMQEMIRKIKEDEQKLYQMDLRLLQEQINPHFLYNTLDTIVWLIEAEQPDEAVDMVVTLSNFFRLVLSKGREYITIREEEQHIRSYLEIQQVRYRDILEYEIRIDPEIYEYRILKLTLQPVVENALYHGIKYKRAPGRIVVTGYRYGREIHLIVEDDGVGMDEDSLKNLCSSIEKPCKETEKGFGLANVNERIRMYFGARYGMQITSQKDRGTRVEIVIPADKMKEEGARGDENT